MPPYLLRLLFLYSSVLLVVRSIDAQSVFSLQRAQSSLISAPLKGYAAFFYETTHQVKDQRGEWNFLLKESELYYELRDHNAIAKYRKPNGEVGFVTGLGEEVRSRK